MDADLRFLNLEGLDATQANQILFLLHPSNLCPKIEFPWSSVCCNGDEVDKKGNKSLNVHAPVFETHIPFKNLSNTSHQVYFSLYNNGSNFSVPIAKSSPSFYAHENRTKLQSFSNGVNHEVGDFNECVSPSQSSKTVSSDSGYSNDNPVSSSFKLNPTVSCFVPQSIRTTCVPSEPPIKPVLSHESIDKLQKFNESSQPVNYDLLQEKVVQAHEERECIAVRADQTVSSDTSPAQREDGDLVAATTTTDASTENSKVTVKPVNRSWAQIVQSGQPSAVPSAKSSLENNCKNRKEVKNVEKLSIEDDKLALVLGRHLHELELDFKPVYLQPRGLINRRNWCYINATLQALFGCSPFYSMIRNLPIGPAVQRGKSSTPLIDSMVKMTYEFSVLPTSQEEVQVGQPFQPDIMYDMLRDLKSDCVKGQQEDAEEFLSFILNNMHEEMVKVIKNYEQINSIALGNEVDENGDQSETEEEEWQVIGSKHKGMVTRKVAEHKTPISDLLGGQIKSFLTTSGNKTSASIQPFFTLQLDVQSENVTSVSEALKEMTVKEPIQGYTCAKTKQEVEAYSHVALQKLPPVLILHLKRFVYNKNGGCKKVMKKTDYPLELELNRELFSSDVKKSHRNRVYKLFAVMYHDGEEAIKGHYISDVYNPGSQTWFRFDDRQVTAVTEAQVLSHSPPRVPYLLFYQDGAHICM
ncbi:ubiquitin carboxyl-terminal hydrolase 10 [Parasteatoda tepidariorum]|uniref:ubiquitin carboxyl-terminal hydrolase 10 n=1 Tax=Parasteatoda tepidariorum TaxID=114398 RepID=UPI001C728749|nr:ubiquitin carboxyl-terminal hydrolase 10 isoform X2 [Parasteatoda tepidariorum]